MEWLRRTRYSTFEGLKDWTRLVLRENLHVFLLIFIAILIVAAVLEFVFEVSANNQQFSSIGDAVWWAIVTIATVGYGDKVPHSAGGRVVAGVVMLSFIIFMPVLSASIASVLVSRRMKEERGLEAVKAIDHVVICGWNHNGERILEGFKSQSPRFENTIVLVNELAEDRIQEILYRFSTLNLKFISGNYTSEATLARANIKFAKSAVILADWTTDTAEKSDEKCILATLTIKSMAPKTWVSAELMDAENRPHLKRASADEIIVDGEYSGYLLTAATLSPGITNVVRELMTFGYGSEIWHRKIPPQFVGKTFEELARHYLDTSGEILIGVITRQKSIALEDVLKDDFSQIDEFIKRKFEQAGKKTLSQEVESVGVKVNPGREYVISDSDLAVVISAPKE